MKKAVLLISHGSHSSQTVREIEVLIEKLKKKSPSTIFHYAFLEIAFPSISQGIDLCVKDGANEVIVLLNFLNSGRHVDQDIPAIVKESQKKYPNVSIVITKPVGQHVGIVDLFLDLIK